MSVGGTVSVDSAGAAHRHINERIADYASRGSFEFDSEWGQDAFVYEAIRNGRPVNAEAFAEATEGGRLPADVSIEGYAREGDRYVYKPPKSESGGLQGFPERTAPPSERETVVAEHTNPDGTRKPTWMKAPNGEPTRLTESRWVESRTPSFKARHGDWETLSRAREVRGMKPVETITSRNIDGDEAKRIYKDLGDATTPDGETVRFASSMFGKLIHDKRRNLTYNVMQHFKPLLEKSIHAYTEENRNPRKHKNILSYKNYVSKVSVDGVDYFVRFTVQKSKPNQHNFHGAFVSDVKMERVSDGNLADFLPEDNSRAENPLTDLKLADWLESVKPSSVRIDLDANGEPVLNGAGVPLMGAPAGAFESRDVESSGTAPTGKSISRADLVTRPKKLFPEVAFRGRATWRRRGVLGWFDRTNALIRSNDRNDIATIAHELGHYIDSATNTTESAMPAEVSAELLRMGKKLYPKEPPNGWRSEGMAELMQGGGGQGAQHDTERHHEPYRQQAHGRRSDRRSRA